jgi:hypothetical protein
MDMPVFPDDLVPKFIQGINILSGWFPYIHGICVDNQGKPLLFYISNDISRGGLGFAFIVQGRTYTGHFGKSVYNYSNGLLTIGTKRKFTIDFHHPHKVRIDISSAITIALEITYRGPPLWYGKGMDPADMVDLTPTCSAGGYDAPCRISGKVTSSTRSFSFSGYGDYGHIWRLGSFRWKESNSRWIVFNDSRYYGVATKTYDFRTGEQLASTGRFGVEDGPAFAFDDFEWIDDNLQPPRYVNVRGPVRECNRKAETKIDLETIQSVNLFIPSIWTQHRLAGLLDTTKFDGSAWCETHRPVETSRSAHVMAERYLPDKVTKLYCKFSPKITESVKKHETLRAALELITKRCVKSF